MSTAGWLFIIGGLALFLRIVMRPNPSDEKIQEYQRRRPQVTDPTIPRRS